ncbi:MerR family transcriptional regulator [Frigidibacter sp. MR17.14]|uniref:MerR family transcriptional regulator n=1 Tax=Frigidibacter sp. MR17.14 TaxID=3126509 RepID=UPI003012EDA2
MDTTAETTGDGAPRKARAGRGSSGGASAAGAPKSDDAFRTISEVAALLDVPAHVLRFWETRFTQVKPLKRAGGRRYYRPADVALLSGIRKLLHDDGLAIRGVQKMLREQGIRSVTAAATHEAAAVAAGTELPASDVPASDVSASDVSAADAGAPAPRRPRHAPAVPSPRSGPSPEPLPEPQPEADPDEPDLLSLMLAPQAPASVPNRAAAPDPAPPALAPAKPAAPSPILPVLALPDLPEIDEDPAVEPPVSTLARACEAAPRGLDALIARLAALRARLG